MFKPYNVEEELILPGAIDMCTKMINEKVANQLKNIHFYSHNSLLFKILYSELGSFLQSLLLHTEVRWLSNVVKEFMNDESKYFHF